MSEEPQDDHPDISDDEVDALLDKGKTGGMAADAEQGVKPYDLVAPDQIVRGRMPSLDRINERWVGEFRERLARLLRQSVDVALADVQLGSFGEWLARLPDPTSFNLYMVNPWRRNALIAVEGNLLFVLVDAYYGGGGKAADKEPREALTPAEQRLNKTLVELVTGLFQDAFAPIAAIEFDFQKSEADPSYAAIATSSEIVVLTRLDVSLRELGGAISVVFPLSMLDPVREKLAAGLKSVSAETKQRWVKSLRAHLERTQLELSSVFLETELSMRELLQFKPGDILPIEMPRTATIYADGKPLLSGKFGTSRGYNAVSVIEAISDSWDEGAKESQV